MTNYENNVISYLIFMNVAAQLLAQGIITEREYVKIDRIIAKKNGLDSSTIFSDCC